MYYFFMLKSKKGGTDGRCLPFLYIDVCVD